MAKLTIEEFNKKNEEIHKLIERLLKQFADEKIDPAHVMIATAHIAGLIAGARHFPIETITCLAQIASLVSSDYIKEKSELENFTSDIVN